MVKALTFTMAFSRPVPHSPVICHIPAKSRRKVLSLVMFHVKQISENCSFSVEIERVCVILSKNENGYLYPELR